MAVVKEDIRTRLANALNDQVLVDVLEAEKSIPSNIVPFREAYGQTIDVDDADWRKLTGDSHRDLAPMTQKRMVDLGVYLWESNMLANRIVELPIAFMLAEGVTVTADDETVSEVIESFWFDPINRMDIKLIKKVRELGLFGEQCWPTFVNEFNGHVRLGYLDPVVIETVVMDPDNPEQPIGVITKKDRKGRARRYRVIVNGNDNDLFTQRTVEIRETFDTGECFYFNVNSLSTSTRGRSDLLPQIDWLDAYEQFLFGELERSSFARAFIWDVTLKNATPEEIKKRAQEIRVPNPGSVRVHNDSEEWRTESPDLGSEDTEKNARTFRNHSLGGASIPEHWFGGGGDVNRATAGEMGEPTFKVMAMRRQFIKYMLCEVITYAIRQSELSMGGEPDMRDDIYKFEVQFPEMVSKDVSKYATALTQVVMGVAAAITQGLMTKERGLQIIEKITSRLGVEFDAKTELVNALKEAGSEKEEDAFKEPAAGKDG
ncbi:MAG: hypothetical protein COA54_02465 [Thiotrichaceae bacterium]|nr:MAG: hypothetical protein COA54_02465 [Thiotrichaceae bacterium]